MIYSEVFFVPMYQNQPLFGEICAELAAHRYSFHYAYNFTFNGQSGRLFSADALFVSPNLLDQSKKMLPGYNLDGTSKKSARQVWRIWTR